MGIYGLQRYVARLVIRVREGPTLCGVGIDMISGTLPGLSSA